MLAEKREKVKWSQDPRNCRWSRDKSKYGYRMLERMGWTEGKGLGTNESGDTTHVKISKKDDCRGVGCKRGRDEEWLEHQDTFDKLLSDLNARQCNGGAVPTTNQQPDEQAEGGRTLVDNAVESKKLVYKRFLHSKDLSMQSSEDLDCVLGRKKRRKPSISKQELDVKGTVKDTPTGTVKDTPMGTVQDTLTTSHGITTVTKTQSVQEYFSMKMQAKRSSTTKKKAKK